MNQADQAKVIKHVVARLKNVLGEPKAEDPAEYINEFVKALGRFSPDELERGVDRLFTRLRFTRWPLIGEVVQACHDAKEMAKLGSGTQSFQPTDRRRVYESVNEFVSGHPTRHLWEWSHDFRSLPLVKRAESEGWGKELRSAVRFRVTQDVQSGANFKPPEDYLPVDQEMIAYWSEGAARTKRAMAWREEHLNSKIKGTNFKPVGAALGGTNA